MSPLREGTYGWLGWALGSSCHPMRVPRLYPRPFSQLSRQKVTRAHCSGYAAKVATFCYFSSSRDA
jgi:hypothetical protein